MGTEKRERQKANRQARLEQEAEEQRREQTKGRVIKWGAIIAVVLLAAAAFAFFSGGDDDDDQAVEAGDETTETTETTEAGTTDTTGATDADAAASAPIECPAADGSSERIIDFEGPPPDCIDPAASYTAVFDTNQGEIRVELDTEVTPKTTNNFVFLSRYHYYDGTTIFRTDPSIDIFQGGAPHTEDNTDPGPGYTIDDEGNADFTYEPGQLVMARTSAPNSASGQFFFSAGPNTALLDSQGTYVVFGETTEGLDVVESILALHEDDPSNALGGGPSEAVIINTVTIVES